MPPQQLLIDWCILAAAAAVISWLALALVRPWLKRRALAHPNRRSSHREPTPQGGGLVVVPVALVAATYVLWRAGLWPLGGVAHAAVAATAACALVVVGLLDDIKGLSIGVRLWAQMLTVGIVLVTIPWDARLTGYPLLIERAVLFFAGIWFVNLFNFMDGIDWISATETIAIGIGVAALAVAGLVPTPLGWIAVALVGATAGFVPWNAPPARLFLGDAGSLPLGLLLGTLLVHVALSGALAAALILPLYHVADATITLTRRVIRREPVWEAHRQHFYQQALRHGFSVREIVASIAALDLLLIAIAVATTAIGGTVIGIAGFALALVAVAALLGVFARDWT